MIERALAEGSTFLQRDEAVVHLVETEPGRYFYVVVNVERDLVITVSDHRVRPREVARLIERFGWEPK